MPDDMTVGETIRARRIELGWTQKKLGEKAGIAEPTIRRYELGKLKPKIETLQKIAKALGVSVYTLADFDMSNEMLCQRSIATHELYGDLADLVSEFAYYAEQLNEMGRRTAVERVEELTEIPKYRREETPPAPAEEDK